MPREFVNIESDLGTIAPTEKTRFDRLVDPGSPNSLLVKCNMYPSAGEDIPQTEVSDLMEVIVGSDKLLERASELVKKVAVVTKVGGVVNNDLVDEAIFYVRQKIKEATTHIDDDNLVLASGDKIPIGPLIIHRYFEARLKLEMLLDPATANEAKLLFAGLKDFPAVHHVPALDADLNDLATKYPYLDLGPAIKVNLSTPLSGKEISALQSLDPAKLSWLNYGSLDQLMDKVSHHAGGRPEQISKYTIDSLTELKSTLELRSGPVRDAGGTNVLINSENFTIARIDEIIGAIDQVLNAAQNIESGDDDYGIQGYRLAILDGTREAGMSLRRFLNYAEAQNPPYTQEFQDNLIDAITHLEAMSAFIASGQGISSSNPREQAENQRRAKLQQQFLDELATRLEVVRDRIITAGGAKARGETGAKTDWILDTDRQRVENKNEEWRNWYLYQYAYVSDHQGEAMAKRFLHETAQDFMIRYYDSNAKSTWTEGTSFIGLALACLDFGRTRKLDYLKK